MKEIVQFFYFSVVFLFLGLSVGGAYAQNGYNAHNFLWGTYLNNNDPDPPNAAFLEGQPFVSDSGITIVAVRAIGIIDFGNEIDSLSGGVFGPTNSGLNSYFGLIRRIGVDGKLLNVYKIESKPPYGIKICAVLPGNAGAARVILFSNSYVTVNGAPLKIDSKDSLVITSLEILPNGSLGKVELLAQTLGGSVGNWPPYGQTPSNFPVTAFSGPDGGLIFSSITWPNLLNVQGASGRWQPLGSGKNIFMLDKNNKIGMATRFSGLCSCRFCGPPWGYTSWWCKKRLFY